MKNIALISLFFISAGITFLINCVYIIFQIPTFFYNIQKADFKALLVRMPQSVRAAVKLFDENGLRHNYHYLVAIQNQIPHWDSKIQAEYADIICISRLKSDPKAFEAEILGLPEQLKDIRQLNTGAIGNLAYLSIHHPNAEVRQKCKNTLFQIKDYYEMFR